ncbi:hypothetical protein K9M47_03670 [Candidatus Gracilibacteria bacterium]|nr:hypothetical protein [Candidatus Gracilibacteria bacterium]MCF7898907.1 hypothetical protein [Candidatus Paceibacterota bacterium]
MLIEEEPKNGGDINPDALEGVFEEIIEEDEVTLMASNYGDEDADDLDVAFRDDEGHW